MEAQGATQRLVSAQVNIPAPFSWILAALDFLTLQPLASLFFSPCAFVDYKTTIVFVTMSPFLLLPVTIFMSLLYSLFDAARTLGWRAAVKEDWSGLLSKSVDKGIDVYIVLVQMLFTTVCVSIFDHYHCKGPFVVGKGRTKRMLASNFGKSCESPSYKAGP